MPAIELELKLSLDADVSICEEGIEVLVFDAVDDVLAEKIIPWEELENYPFEYSKIPLDNRDVLVCGQHHNGAQELEDLICKMEESARKMRQRLEESSLFFRDDWVKDTADDPDLAHQKSYLDGKYTKPFSYDMVKKND